jgi:thioredoxin reductase (NADPH)
MTATLDLVIVGSGPAGLFAAFQAGMLGISTTIIESLEIVGGQCSNLYPEKPIYDIPAYPRILAQELINKLQEQIQPFKPQIQLNEELVKLEKHEELLKLTTNKGIYFAKAVILATGGGSFMPNKPPLEDLAKFESKSILYKILEPSLFKDKIIVIAGGGDSAIDWTINLAEIAKKTYLVHRREKFRAMDANIQKVQALIAENKLELVVPYQLSKLEGKNNQLTAVEVINFNKEKKRISCDFLLPFFGIAFDHKLLNTLSADKNTTGKNLIVSPNTMETSQNRLFAIGDIADYPGKLNLILTGFAEAALAVHSAYKRIHPDKVMHFEHSTSKGIPL